MLEYMYIFVVFFFNVIIYFKKKLVFKEYLYLIKRLVSDY